MNASVMDVVAANGALSRLVQTEIDNAAAVGRSIAASEAFVWATTGTDDPLLRLIGQAAGDLVEVEGDIDDATDRLIRVANEARRHVQDGLHAPTTPTQSLSAELDRLYLRREWLAGWYKASVQAWTAVQA